MAAVAEAAGVRRQNASELRERQGQGMGIPRELGAVEAGGIGQQGLATGVGKRKQLDERAMRWSGK
jgi:hypothetical protein